MGYSYHSEIVEYGLGPMGTLQRYLASAGELGY
jgi:hypothetical protein